MDKTQQAAQLRLTADILETGHPWEWQTSDGEWVKPTIRTELSHVISDGLIIRLALATPPDGRALHNPGKLTDEEVGAGWRLTLVGEGRHVKAEAWMANSETWQERGIKADTYLECFTYRVPLTVPWPEVEKPDPYAELKEAHAAGKVIQCVTLSGDWVDCTSLNPPRWNVPVDSYRIKSEEPVFQLPPPPPGMRWHREDGWEEGDLPQGMRPLVVGEKEHDEDEFGSRINNAWMPTPDSGKVVGAYYKVRTRRPLTFNHAGKQWTWHRPGDPMPCDGEKNVCALLVDGTMDDCESAPKAKLLEWGDEGIVSIIGWRYADEKKTVPLGPEDVPPGSVFRSNDQPTTTFWTVTQVWEDGFYLRGDSMPWDTARERMQINRSIPLTGKWNPDAWEPCSKPA